MVKTIRIASLAAIAFAGLVLLAGCSLGYSIFPGALMSYEGYADLSGYIEQDRIWDFNFQIIRDSRPTSGYPEYLVLANDDRSFSGVHVAIFDANLKALGKFTIDELDAMDPGAPYGGRGAMVDASGGIIVGNRTFTMGTQRVTYARTPPMTLHTLGLALPEASESNYVNIWTENLSSVFFNYTTFSPDWSTSTPRSPVFLGGTFDAKILNLWVRDTDVAAIVRVEGQGTDIHLLDRAMFAANTLGTPIHDFYAGSSVYSEPDIWLETLGYTDDGFAAFFSGPISRYALFRTDGSLIVSSEAPSDDEWPREQRHVYGRTAGWFILDRTAMNLARRAWWWL